MTLRWIEGFESHREFNPSAVNSLASKYKDRGGIFSGATHVQGTGRIAGTSFQSPTGGGLLNLSPGPEDASYAGFVLGFGAYITGFFTNTRIQIRDGGADVLSFNLVNSGGTGFVIEARRGGGVGTLLGTTTALAYDTWHYLEIKILVNSSAGTIEIRNNEVTLASLSGANTDGAGTGTADQFLILGGFAEGSRLDDLYWLDTDGGTRDDFLGDQVVEKIDFNADGSFDAFTPANGGTHIAEVGEDDEHDDDDTYVSTTLSDATDTYEKAAPSFTGGSISGLILHTDARLTAAGTRTLRHVIRDEDDGSLHNANSVIHTINSLSYKSFSSVVEVHPETGVPFTLAQFTDDEFGFKSVV